jgi:hypothetical protein
MRSACFSGWLVVAASVVLWRCAIDDRAPREVMAPNQPSEGSAAGAESRGSTASPPNQSAAGSGGDPGSPGNPGGGAEPPAGGLGGTSNAGISNGSGGANAQTTDSPPGAAGSGSGGMTSGGAAGNTSGLPPDPTGSGASGASGAGPVDVPGGGSAPTLSVNCSAFTACGGDLAGTWAYTDACPGGNFDSLLSLCATATVQHERGGAATLSFNGGQVARNGAPVGDGVITFPSTCDLPLSCADLAAVIGSAGSCGEVSTSCACRTPFSIAWPAQAYAIAGSQLTLADGRTFDYCVDGERLTYRETGDAGEPGVFTLQRN